MFTRINQSINGYSMRSDFLQDLAIYDNKKLWNENMNEFSFKVQNFNEKLNEDSSNQFNQNLSENNTLSLRQNLNQMQKDEIIEILLEQIRQNKNTCQSSKRSRRWKESQESQQNRKIIMITDRPFISAQRDNGEQNEKYQELVKGFQEYINNTNQAQRHYLKAIQDVKKQNKYLNSQVQSLKQSSISNNHYISAQQKLEQQQKETLINKLEQTIQNYLKINNQLNSRIQKLQRLKKQQFQHNNKLKEELDQLDNINQQLKKQNQSLKTQNTSFKIIIDQLKDYVYERRQLKDNINASNESNDNDNSQSINVSYSSKRNLKHMDSNAQYKIKQEVQYNSVMNGSEIKMSEDNENDSSCVIFQNNANNGSKEFYRQRSSNQVQRQSSNHSSLANKSYKLNMEDQNDLNQNTLRQLRISNKQLKSANMKLEEVLERKSQKIRSLLDDIQTITEEKVQIKEELVTLKCKLKKYQENENINRSDEYARESAKSKTSKQAYNDNENEKCHNIGGVKMTVSSIYSLKNSQSNSKISSSKGEELICYAKNDQNLKQFHHSHSKSITTNYQEYENDRIEICGNEEKNNLKQSNKSDQYYIAKSLYSSNKKPVNNSTLLERSDYNYEISPLLMRKKSSYAELTSISGSTSNNLSNLIKEKISALSINYSNIEINVSKGNKENFIQKAKSNTKVYQT